MRRLLDSDGVTGDVWHYDEATDTATIERVNPDISPLIDANKRLQNETDGYSPSRELRKVATIDMVTYEMWMKEAFGDFYMQRPAKDRMAVIKRKLNDPDFRSYRTVAAKI